MTSKVKAVPEGYHTVTPYLIIKNAAQAMDFYKKAFGAKEILRMPMPDGSVAHAEMMIGDSRFMLSEHNAEMGARSPDSFGGTPVLMHIYVEDADATVRQALASGAKELRPVENKFYGDKSGLIADPFGHVWNVATHVEDVSEEELNKRFKELMKETSHC